MIPTFAQIADKLILFGPRVTAGRRLFTPAQARPGADRVLDDFALSLMRSFPQARTHDLVLVTREFLSKHPCLDAWYDAALTERKLEVVFRSGEPQVRSQLEAGHVNDFEDWMTLAAQIDQDALIGLQFAREFERPAEAGDLCHWGVYARLQDIRVLGQPMWLRFRDIHTHLSGCEIAPLVWQELLTDQIGVDRLPFYHEGGPAGWGEGHDTRGEERGEVVDALEAGRKLMRWFPAAAAPPGTALVRTLWSERATIIRAWLAYRRTGDPQIGKWLDVYLHGKNRFIRRHIQSPKNNPGLETFRRHFDLLRPIRRRQSDSVVRRYLARWRDFAYDAPGLDHIEFRIAPQPDVKAYRSLLENVRASFRDIVKRPPRPGVPPRSMPRFVVHFIRPRTDPTSSTGGLSLSALYHQLDKECAALNTFLNATGRDAAERELRELIVGLDVCNIERDAPIEYFATYLNILKEPKSRQRFSYFMELSPIYFERWRESLAQTGRRGRSAALGLTVHAGEDYYHPVIGLREIWNAVTLCNMRAGDRIGHGLALGTDPQEFHRRFGANLVVPRGVLLDTVVWMLRRIGTLADADLRSSRALEDLVVELSRQVFGRAMTPGSLKLAMDLRGFPLRQLEFEQERFRRAIGLLGPGCDVTEIYGGEAFDHSVARRRAQLVTMPPEFAQPWMVETMLKIRGLVIEKVVEVGVTVEMAPSSNRALGEFDDMSQHPVLALKTREPRLRVAVACDDPGNFGTRIENEYALVSQGLRDRGHEPDEIESLLKDIAHVSRQSAFGRLAFSNDPEAWEPRRQGLPVRHDPDAGPD
ncbi:MAG: hypothetical protein ACFBRM_03475 [Pikeienuella sp.]